MPTTITYYKVVVLDVDYYETRITDERHFANEAEAQNFAKKSDHAVVIKMN